MDNRIYQDFVELALSLARGKRVKRMVAGLFYTYAEVERTGAGLAYLEREAIESCCEAGGISYWKQPADLIIKNYLTSHPVESSLALAVMNALFNHRKEVLKDTSSDPLLEIPLTLEDEVLMIGYFEPIFKRLQGKVKRIRVIEKNEFYGGLKGLRDLKNLSLAIITSATLSNKTFHLYLPYLKEVPEVILMGPSTPLAPEIFQATPITWLSGAIVKDTEMLFRLVCEGKGTPAFFKSGALEKINLRVKQR